MPSKSNTSAAQPIGQQVIQTKTEPWEGQKPHLQTVFSEAWKNYQKPPQYYPGATYTPFSNATNDALNAVEARARGGSSLLDTARSQMEATARGDFLKPDSNPYLQGQYNAAVRPMVENFQTAIAPGIASSALTKGRYGSQAYNNQQAQAQDTLGRNLGEVATNLWGQNYQNERSRMATAAAAAPEFAQADYADAAQLANVGAAREGQAGLELQDAINRWNFNEQAPWANLANYQNMIQGNYGQTDTRTQPIYGASGGGNTFGQVVSGLGGLGLLASGLGGGSGLASLFGGFREGGKVHADPRKNAPRNQPPALRVASDRTPRNDNRPAMPVNVRAKRRSWGA